MNGSVKQMKKVQQYKLELIDCINSLHSFVDIINNVDKAEYDEKTDRFSVVIANGVYTIRFHYMFIIAVIQESVEDTLNPITIYGKDELLENTLDDFIQVIACAVTDKNKYGQDDDFFDSYIDIIEVPERKRGISIQSNTDLNRKVSKRI